MGDYSYKKESDIVLPAVFTLDIRNQEATGQLYGSSCISLPCRGCQACQCQCVQCKSRNLTLEQAGQSTDIEKLFIRALAA